MTGPGGTPARNDSDDARHLGWETQSDWEPQPGNENTRGGSTPVVWEQPRYDRASSPDVSDPVRPTRPQGLPERPGIPRSLIVGAVVGVVVFATVLFGIAVMGGMMMTPVMFFILPGLFFVSRVGRLHGRHGGHGRRH